MAKKKNSYEKKAHQNNMLNGTSTGLLKKESVLASTVTDIVVGGLLGGAAGAVVGRGSFFAGMAVTGVGHYFKSRAAAAFGVGMMATGGYQLTSLQGTPVSGLEGVKDRLLAFKDDLKHRLFLDKIIKSKKASTEDSGGATNGMGQVQYFNYPNKELQGQPLDFSALENIEKQIAASAKKFSSTQMTGMRSDGITSVEDYNL